jgi:hypothetical protein
VPPTTGLAGGVKVKVMAWESRTMVMDWVTVGAASYSGLPAWSAAMTQVPTRLKITSPPRSTLHCPVPLKVTRLPEPPPSATTP